MKNQWVEEGQNATARGIQEVAKPNEAEILRELKGNFQAADWPCIDRLLGDCAYLQFSSKEEEERFSTTLLEANSVARQDERPFGSLCWELFGKTHPDWSDEDYETYFWSGGGFFSLPTVEAARGGTILFVAESQVDTLRKNPWICRHQDDAGRTVYIDIRTIDELVIVPDDSIGQKADKLLILCGA